MSEPTRQQIKEAFIKTIERWEKIVEDVDYFHETECSLCLLESTTGEDYVCTEFCPIRLYTTKNSCHETPYQDFFRDKTSDNALAELNFLRKVYIWWMEKTEKEEKSLHERCLDNNPKEEKKKEWENVTTKIQLETEECGIDNEPYFFMRLMHGSEQIGILSKGKLDIYSGASPRYKVEYSIDAIRILKKV